MKALLVTSHVHFVPNNYDSLIIDLARCEHVGGLLVIDNLNASLLKMASGITLIGARRLGLQIFKNAVSRSQSHRARAYELQNKPIWLVRSINSAQSQKIIADEKFDLVINARTRSIFKSEILELPPMGCINIHHGLLPEQRGVLCDLWALSESRPAGFSIHYMTEKVDAGLIISRTQVSDGSDRDYLAYLRKSAILERQELEKVLHKLANHDAIDLLANENSPSTIYRKTPNAHQIRQMKTNGMRI